MRRVSIPYTANFKIAHAPLPFPPQLFARTLRSLQTLIMTSTSAHTAPTTFVSRGRSDVALYLSLSLSLLRAQRDGAAVSPGARPPCALHTSPSLFRFLHPILAPSPRLPPLPQPIPYAPLLALWPVTLKKSFAYPCAAARTLAHVLPAGKSTDSSRFAPVPSADSDERQIWTRVNE